MQLLKRMDTIVLSVRIGETKIKSPFGYEVQSVILWHSLSNRHSLQVVMIISRGGRDNMYFWKSTQMKPSSSGIM